MLLHILFSLLALYLTRQLFWRWRYDLHKIPSPPGLPILGHTLAFLKGKGDGELTRLRGLWWKDIGCPKIMKVRVLGKTILYITDMECARSVILSKTAPLPRSATATLAIVMSAGNAPDAKTMTTVHNVTPYVKAMRKVYATAFQSSNLKMAFPKLTQILDQMAAIIDSNKDSGPIDFQELCVKMTLDTIGRVAMDANLGGLDESRDLHGLLQDVSLISFKRMFNLRAYLCSKYFSKVASVQREEATIRRLTAEWDKLLDEIMKHPDPPLGMNPLWYELKSLVDPETRKPITYKSLRSEMATAVLAGMDTTGHQLAWILAALASHPGVVAKLLAEMAEHGLYGLESRELEFDDLAELHYLNAVVKEAMRLVHTSTSLIPRVVEHDMKIMGYRVPKGTTVSLASTRWMGTEEEWGDPEVFRPERWLTKEDMSQKHYFGFSFGPRDCVGQKLAMIEMRAAVVHLLKRYELKPTVPLLDLMKNCQNGVTIRAVDGIRLHVKQRSMSSNP